VPTRKKILFIAEAVTLAHLGRPLALANALHARDYEIHVACADGYDFCFRNSSFARARIRSISSSHFLDSLARGRPVYDYATLCDYVIDDMRLLQALQPDLVVGDFRLSLSVSARLAGIPYVAITNAYWSPHVRQHFTVPDIPVTKFLPVAMANGLFSLVRPVAFGMHAVPMNRVRRKFGLPLLGFDLRKVYTDADHTAYADIPELFPAVDLPANHSYLGPIIWSPPLDKPAWWNALPEDRPIIYVTLGSSGQGRLLPLVLQALESLPVMVIAASAGKSKLHSVPRNCYVADYLPGEEASRLASLVICNGGSPTSQQALTFGVPVIGIAGNLDQFLNMQRIQEVGAGKMLRADRFSAPALQKVVKELIRNTIYADAARKISEQFRHYPAGRRFASLLDAILAKHGTRDAGKPGVNGSAGQGTSHG
jgi:UDP:flavonoid glycosyltransferase YjiC (YdhE family)